MKRLPTFRSAAAIVALMTAFSSSVHSQSPPGAPASDSISESSGDETSTPQSLQLPRPYTIPIDPTTGIQGEPAKPGATSPSLTSERITPSAQSLGLEPVVVPLPGTNEAGTYGTQNYVDQNYGAQNYGDQNYGDGTAELESIGVEPLRTQNPPPAQTLSPAQTPPAVTAMGTQPVGQPLGVEPVLVPELEVEPVGYEPIDGGDSGLGSLGMDYIDVEPFGIESNATCDCCPSISYRSECSQCRNRRCLVPGQSDRVFYGGWLQQGFTSNFGSPHNRSNEPLLFNDRSNDYRLNQLYFYAEKDVCVNRREWDLGGRVDVLVGSDARFLTVAGLERHKNRTPKWNSETDDYGIALPQAYFEVAAPWFNGVSIKVGHFYAIQGYESVPAPDNFFYSHSYAFLYGEPFTHTGVLTETHANDRLTLRAGYTNGWDVFDSDSREFGVLAGFTLDSADKRTSLTATLHSGDDVTNSRVGGVLLDANRHLLSVVLQHKLGKGWRYVFQNDIGYQENGDIVVNLPTGSISHDKSKWYGISQYLIRDVSEELSSGMRVEWFRDQDHSRIGIPVSFNPGGPTFRGGNYVAVTGGLNWRPHPNVAIRPELRWDYSDLKGNGNAPGGNPGFRAFDDNTSSSQGTAALDLILLF